MNQDQTEFDVIIVGGRPAGSTLATRLGRYGLRVLLLERATLPSLPAVSSPIIYGPTMALLDEIGADEAEYARGTPPIRAMSLHGRMFQADFPLPQAEGRNYAYAVDRARFDAALWQVAIRQPNVTGWQGFHVTDLLCDGGRVVGVAGKDAASVRHSLRARLVVGADGRFGIVARKTNAATRDAHTENPTSLLYAYWQGVRPYHADGAAASVAYEGAPGLGYLLMDSADDTTAVVIEGRADAITPGPGQAESFYLDLLRENPAVWSRLAGAERITTVRGMQRVGNFYRQPGGPGWALVGDAYHQKDPLDGQGIYNAVFTAKALAWAVRYWWRGQKTWAEALDWYDETARIKTYAMYKSVLGRVKASLYLESAPPEWVQTTLARWTLHDPTMQRLLGGFVTRQIPPDALRLMTPPVMMGAVLRGGLRDAREGLRSRLRGLLG